MDERIRAERDALKRKNREMQRDCYSLVALRNRLPEIVRESVDGLPVSLCESGCGPVFLGEHGECPECGAETRVSTVEIPETEGSA